MATPLSLNPAPAPPAPDASRPAGAGARSRGVRPAGHPSPPLPEAVEAALRSIGHRLIVGDRMAEFSFDRELGRVVIRVYSETQPPEVIRQIPPEEFLRFAAKFRELVGVLFEGVA